MKVTIYSIYDSKASAYAPPFFLLRDQQAIRAFSDTAKDPSTQLNRHPADFTLHKIGLFDDQSGKIEPCKQPEFLAAATEFTGKPAAATEFTGKPETKGETTNV